MRHAFRFALSAVLFTAVYWAGADGLPKEVADPEAAGAAATKDRATLEKEFTEAMSGVEMVGRFTMEGQEGEPKEEKYTIEKVQKLEGDDWEITARIQFLGKDVSVPLVLPVLWAGDTPVISVTDVTIPGLGTYTARVIIYDGQYAGTWSGGDHGGHLWGKIQKIAEPVDDGDAPDEPAGAEPEDDAPKLKTAEKAKPARKTKG